MPKVSKAYSNFTAGELTPKLYGRTDIAKYDNGAQTVENFLVQPHGGLTRRPGTQFVAEVKTSSASTRLVPFEFNVEQAYVLEFGNLYFRIYKDGGQVVSGGSAVEVTTTYTTADLDTLKFAQVADTMFVVSPNHAPRKITRTSHTAWTIADATLQRGPMGDANITATTLTCSAASGSITVTASASAFVATDVVRLIKTQEGYIKITAFNSATVVVGTVQELEDGRSELLPSYVATTISFHEGDPDATGLEHNDRIQDTAAKFIDEGFKKGQTVTMAGSTSNNTSAGFLIVDVTDSVMTFAPGADCADEAAGDSVTVAGKLIATDVWSLGAFSGTTGFPRAVTFYEQRLVFAGTDDQPQTLFFSQGGDFENFESGVNADDGMVYTIGSDEVNVIRFLASTRNMIVGTSGGEFVVRAGGADEAITPTNIQIKQQTNHGSADQIPIQVGNAVLFVQRAKRKIRELQYNFDVDGYIAPDVSLISEIVERVVRVPGDLDEDEIYLIVKRTIDGSTVRYIEYIKNFDFGTDISEAVFVDSALSFSGATSTLAGAEAADQTTITLASGTNFSSAGAIRIGNEIITYTGKSTNDLTGCVRGVVGVAGAFVAGFAGPFGVDCGVGGY